MTNADSPARATADQAATTAEDSANSSGLEQLPERVRVHALAKLLGSSSREVLSRLGELGENARSPQSSVPRSTALRVAGMFEGTGATQQQRTPTEPTEPTASTATAATSTAAATQPASETGGSSQNSSNAPLFAASSPVFLPPEPSTKPTGREKSTQQQSAAGATPGGRQDTATSLAPAGEQESSGSKDADSALDSSEEGAESDTSETAESDEQSDTDADGSRKRRRRGRRGRGRGRGTEGAADEGTDSDDGDDGAGQGENQQGKQEDNQSENQQNNQSGKQSGKQQNNQSDKQQGKQEDNQSGKQQNNQSGKQSGKQQNNQSDKQQNNQSGNQQGTASGQSSSENKQQDGQRGNVTTGSEDGSANATADDDTDGSGSSEGEESKRRRRRRRRKSGGNAENSPENDPPNTVTHVRDSSQAGRETDTDGVRSVRGSTRLEAKRQRRRDGRDSGRRRAPLLSEAEFLARRESVERAMVVAEKDGATQLGVLEDGVLVEHFVTSSGSGSIVGNVYLGRVQNVLPSMEAAFVDIGRGRNAVLYAGEVDWDSAGLEGKARKIEQALSSGDHVLVQVTKDPLGHKGARLSTQISLPGRFLVYVPSGATTGISRKLAENERRRLKDILKRVVPEDAGVIIRTASEGISEQELERDVQRLREEWDAIKQRSESAANSPSGSGSGSGKPAKAKKSSAPALLYEEPDILIKVVRDLFTEDFGKMEIQGEQAWNTVHSYIEKVAPELTDRVKRYVGTGDVFADYRIDEQLTKALDRKVWLPSGGYLVIDRTEAMTVIDVNTGKFTGSGGNLEETVTRNNLESAEEIVRQLRLRDIGGIIVIDFIDMVLESNRELVLRRLTECLARDRTRHQVAEVTSLGLVQMTRKRLGAGLLESFSSSCEHCNGRGLHITTESNNGANGGDSGSRKRGKGKRGGSDEGSSSASTAPTQHQRESAANAVAAMANASKTAPTATQQSQEAANSGEPDGPPRAEAAVAAPEASAATAERQQPQGNGSGSSQRQDTDPQPSGQQSSAAVQHFETDEQTPARSGRRPTGRHARRAASRPAGPPV